MGRQQRTELPGESVAVWETFARQHGHDFKPPSGYPHDDLAITARIDGAEIALSTRRQKNGAFETRVRATARHAMVGRVEIRTTHWFDSLTGLFRGRTRIGEVELDGTLSTFASSAALLRTLLDPLTLAMLRSLREKHHVALVYEHGAIALRWTGVELSAPLLDSALKLAAYLALAGGAPSPYR